ncbi:MAG: glycosyltransferase family 4 protein [Deltaproteobacteria bacterium]|nr:glycosyltransferase family 4 protein [Deltaproteobacteria bacterium]
MDLAFCLIKYFPFGGLQRDFLRIAELCHGKGHQIDVYTPEWLGDVPAWLQLNLLKVDGFTNHARRLSFSRKLAQAVALKKYDAVVGFSKMPGLDLYYAADSCFAAKIEKRNFCYRHSARCRTYLDLERAVFERKSPTLILMLSENEKHLYQKYFQTQEERLLLLPPGISRDRLRPPDAARLREELRAELGIGEADYMVLMVGSGFKTKGADRALRALAALPEALRAKSFLVVIGKDNFAPFRQMAKRLRVSEKVLFFDGRSDIIRFLVAAEVLIHPAYKENTGTVLLEAMAAQLPVLTTEVCGYSGHIKNANAGVVLSSPFRQTELNDVLADMLVSAYRKNWMTNAADYVRRVDLFSMPEKAAEVIINVAEARG